MIENLLSSALALLIAVFTLRRLLIVAASALPLRSNPHSVRLPTILVAASVRNEEDRLPALFRALERLDYPPDKLRFFLIDDASDDATPGILSSWAANRPSVTLVSFERNRGKSAGLNLAFESSYESELVAVYDADVQPPPDALRALAAPFADDGVGAVSGYRQPLDPDRNVVSRYCALESWVHQLVTQTAKDRLGWNPTTMGAHCLYRRSAVLAVGGFSAGAFSEDIEISLALIAGGWRTRFLPQAAAPSEVAGSRLHFWHQRTRWTRGLYRTRIKASGLETLLVAAGYLDRIAFLASVLAVVFGLMHPLWLLLYISGPGLTLAVALYRAGQGWLGFKYVLACVPMFAMDVLVTLSSTLEETRGRALAWRTGGQR